MNDSHSGRRLIAMTAAIVSAFAAWSMLPRREIMAQQPEGEQYLSALKSTTARTNEALAMYAWQQRETLTVKGKLQKQNLYEVQLSPEGRMERVPIRSPDDSWSSNTQPGLRDWLVQRKMKEINEYAAQVRELVQMYIPPDLERLQADLQQGELKLQTGSDPNEVRLAINDFLKPRDNLILVFNRTSRQIQEIKVSSYLKNPGDPVSASAQFTELPDGTHYMSKMVASGLRKNVTITIENLDHRKL